MKVCKFCGANQSDNRFFCIDCGEKLDNPISDDEEAKINEKIEKKINDLYNKSDPLYVSKSDKEIGTASIIGCVVMIIILIISNYIHRIDAFFYSDSTLYVFIIAFFTPFLFLFSAINALMPKLIWKIEKLRLSFVANGTDDLQPSDFYLICRRIVVKGGFIVGCLGMLFYLVLMVIVK